MQIGGKYCLTGWLKPRLYRQNPPTRVEILESDTKSDLVILFISNSVVIASEAKQSQRLGDCFASLAMTIKGVVKPDLV